MFNKGAFKSKLAAIAGGAQVPLPPAIQSVLNAAPESTQGMVPAGTVDAVQRKVDLVPLATAKLYREPLKYLFNEMPQLAYTHVETCTGAMVATGLAAHGLNNGWIKYTSAMFEAKSKVYVITGTNSLVELGFGQYCTNKDHSATYQNGTSYRQCLIGKPAPGADGFPIGDCSQDSDYPFYFRGTSHGCTATCWEKLDGKSDQSRDYEVNDYFNWNGLPAALQVPGPQGGNPVQTLMTGLSRRQPFTLWLIRRTTNGAHERLLRECSYTIGLDITVAWAGNQPTCTIADASVAGPLIEKPFDAKRPMVTQKTLNNVEKMAMRLPQGAWVEV